MATRNVIYKHTLQVCDSQEVRMRSGSTILSVQIQNGSAVIWSVNDDIDTERTYEQRTILMRVTGGTYSPHGNERYLGTTQIDWFVAHWFERIATSN